MENVQNVKKYQLEDFKPREIFGTRDVQYVPFEDFNCPKVIAINASKHFEQLNKPIK